MNSHNLQNKYALVTGGTKGIGASIAKELLSYGANVIIVARNKENIDKCINEWNAGDAKIIGFQADISDIEECKRIVEFIKKTWGKLDILINNAGMNIRKKTTEYSSKEYEAIMNTNLRSAFELSRKLYPLLQHGESSAIVNISSVAGQTHVRTGAIYGMTKAAMIHLTKYLAVEWANDNIRVNAIAPWYINTPLAQTVLQNNKYYDEVMEHTPLKKIGDPEDIASLAVFLCSNQSKFITGQIISADGGFTIKGF